MVRSILKPIANKLIRELQRKLSTHSLFETWWLLGEVTAVPGENHRPAESRLSF
jgi:hypothetical protein